MAYLSSYLNFLESILREIHPSTAGTEMLELGDQLIIDEGRTRLARDYFLGLGLHYTSVDIHGLNGAVRKNLDKPQQFKDWQDRFDIVTNIGTSEHVAKQYECFQIIHNVTRQNGLMVHIVPLAESKKWQNHSPCAYTHDFFERLAAANGYLILRQETMDESVAIVLKRAGEFKTGREFFKNYVVVREYQPSIRIRIDSFVKRWGLSKIKRDMLAALGK